jgi:transcriptional regulator with XRE-family HTH domain
MIHWNAQDRLGDLLCKRRMERAVSLRQMADTAGVSISVAFRAERGANLCIATWEKLFRALGYELLFDWSDEDGEFVDFIEDEKGRRWQRRHDALLGRR